MFFRMNLHDGCSCFIKPSCQFPQIDLAFSANCRIITALISSWLNVKYLYTYYESGLSTEQPLPDDQLMQNGMKGQTCPEGEIGCKSKQSIPEQPDGREAGSRFGVS